MHYLGMSAMRMPATVSYDPIWMAASIVIAVVASTAAVLFRHEGSNFCSFDGR
jgi:NO-binding membrane sensor protein with MHYT domain